MRLVVIESPYAGDVLTNVAYARHCMQHSLSLGEAPIASHLLYTQPGVLNDSVPRERELGIAAGFEWGNMADAHVFYTDLGMSRGMLAALERANKLGYSVELRSLRDVPHHVFGTNWWEKKK